MSVRGAYSQKVSRELVAGKEIPWVRDGAWRTLSDRDGWFNLTLNQRVQGSSPCAPTTHSVTQEIFLTSHKNARSRGLSCEPAVS